MWNEEKLDAFLEEAIKAYNSKEWKRAEELLVFYLQVRRSDRKAKEILKKVYLATNRPDDAALLR